MIFVDTNYFLRYLLRDTENQYVEAKEVFLKAAQGNIKLITSTVVFFEVVWVLRAGYKRIGRSKAELHSTLLKVLNLEVEFPDREVLVDGINFSLGSSLSLEDCYHLAFCKSKKVRELKTFDRNLGKNFEKMLK